mgnify:CR=1 FL=1
MNISSLKELFEQCYPHENSSDFITIIKRIKKKYPITLLKGPILLTYPNSVKNLSNLTKLLTQDSLHSYFKSVHILPMFESNADGGFAASSYRDIDVSFGTWKDIKEISKTYEIMIDAIFNHTSDEHIWFQKFQKEEKYYKKFYITYDEKFDYTSIVRPRTTPLFTTIKNKKVLTTFSPNQVDLNLKEVKVFYELLHIIEYYISQSISGIRLDAIPYIIKKSHTSCSNLKETYEFTKLLIGCIKYLNNTISIVTEANFSDKENFAYLSKSNSDYIYQFSFSHLLFYCMYHRDFSYFVKWFNKTKKVHKQSLFYISNHDGYALSGIKRILKEEEFNTYISLLKQKKIKINYRQNQKTNVEEPYEVNSTFYSYLKDLDGSYVREKYLLMLHILTQMSGEILFYYLDLIGEENDVESYKKTKENRILHRKKFTLEEYENKLETSEFFPHIQNYLKDRELTQNIDIGVFFSKPFLKIIKSNSEKKFVTYYNISNEKQEIKKEKIILEPFAFISIKKKL